MIQPVKKIARITKREPVFQDRRKHPIRDSGGTLKSVLAIFIAKVLHLDPKNPCLDKKKHSSSILETNSMAVKFKRSSTTLGAVTTRTKLTTRPVLPDMARAKMEVRN